MNESHAPSSDSYSSLPLFFISEYDANDSQKSIVINLKRSDVSCFKSVFIYPGYFLNSFAHSPSGE
jgi:hypothetical protein